jgi:hypothetical protein
VLVQGQVQPLTRLPRQVTIHAQGTTNVMLEVTCSVDEATGEFSAALVLDRLVRPKNTARQQVLVWVQAGSAKTRQVRVWRMGGSG